MATIQPAPKMDLLKKQSTHEIPKIDLSKIDNIPYFIESKIQFSKKKT